MNVSIAAEDPQEPEIIPFKVRQIPVNEWTEKVWGRTRLIHRGQTFEAHELEINAGGYCSLHKHRKRNLFHIQEGLLRVELHRANADGKPEPEFYWQGEHKEGEQCSVRPHEWHRFRALTDCKVLEIYWNDEIDPDDIVRADEGGLAHIG